MENSALTIYEKFSEISRQYADAPAIIENRRTLSFRQLSGMIDSLADSFPDGTKSVGIVMRHRAEMIASIFAVLKRGAMYVPAEPSFPRGRIRYMMTEADVDFILTEKQFEERLEGFKLIFPDCSLCTSPEKEHSRTFRQDPDSPAYVLYTSGTTGRPKGVCVTNRNVCHYAKAFAHEFHPGSGDIMLQYSVCSFDIFVEEVFATLLNGAAIAIPEEEDKKNIGNLMDFVKRHGVTMISGFPYLLAEMNRLPKIPSSLRLLISGGDVLRARYVDRLLDQAEVYNTYGPSETTVCASYYRCNSGAPLEDGTYPIGKAVLGARIRLVDADGKEIPADETGTTGELVISGGGVSNGYIGDHEEENRAFLHLPDGSTAYKSGDLGYYLPDGNIAFLHRADSQIMILGKRVEVMEVESRLNQCRGVERAVVRAFTDEDGLSYMTAYIVPDSSDLKVSDIRKQLSENLTEFMIPEFMVKMPEIPLNSNGKVDIGKLPVVMKER